MKLLKCVLLIGFLSASLSSAAQKADSTSQNDVRLILPDSTGWNIVPENHVVSFEVKTTHPDPPFFSIEGAENLGIQFDSAGRFFWQPSYDLVDRVERMKEFSVIIEANWPHLPEARRVRETVTFLVKHVNRPPVVEEMPVFYVRQSTNNTYQIPAEFVYDLDGDPLVFESVLSSMPEGAKLSAQGQFTWSPSRTQFIALRNQPLVVEFIVRPTRKGG